MAYTKVTDLSTDKVVGLGNKPDQQKQIEGYYLGKRTVENREGGTSTIHVFQTSSGNTGVWGKSDLNSKLSSVKLGTMVLAQFIKIEKLKGGKTMYKFDVMQDRTNTVEVEGDVQSTGDSGYADDEEAYDAGPSSKSGYSDSSSEEDEYAASAAERRAKVQALITKGKKN